MKSSGLYILSVFDMMIFLVRVLFCIYVLVIIVVQMDVLYLVVVITKKN